MPVQTVIDAAQGDRLASWDRLDDTYRTDQFDVFEKRRPHSVESPQGPIEWFEEALTEVSESKVLEPYFEARRGLPK